MSAEHLQLNLQPPLGTSISFAPSPVTFLGTSWLPSGPFCLPHCHLNYFPCLSCNFVSPFKTLTSLLVPHPDTKWRIWDPSLSGPAYLSSPTPSSSLCSPTAWPTYIAFPLVLLTNLWIVTDSTDHRQTWKSKSVSLLSPRFHLTFNSVLGRINFSTSCAFQTVCIQ